MSELSEFTKKVLTAKDKYEAMSILIGENPKNYDLIISKFKKKKEAIFSKHGYNYYFEIKNSVDAGNVWNIVFIGEFYKNYIEDTIRLVKREIEKLNRTINIYIKEKKTVENDNSLSISEKSIRLNSILSNLDKIKLQKKLFTEKLSKVIHSKQKVYKQLNLINIETNFDNRHIKSIEEIKKSIKVINGIRDSFSHIKVGAKVSNIIKIENDSNGLYLEIPIEYLEQFADSRIIIREQDRNLFMNICNTVLPIFKENNIDIRDIDSFFYNVEPSLMHKLLCISDYNYSKLYALPIEIFSIEGFNDYIKNNHMSELLDKKLSEYSNKNVIEVTKNGFSFDLYVGNLAKNTYYEKHFEKYVDRQTFDYLEKKYGYVAMPFLSSHFYSCDNEWLIEHGDYDATLYEMFMLVSSPKYIIDLFDRENINVFNLPQVIWDLTFSKLKIKNIKNILELYHNDYSLLRYMPKEFFVCNENELFDKMSKNCHPLEAKSIFGIDNPKIIAIINYMNSVLSQYKTEYATYIDVKLIKDILIGYKNKKTNNFNKEFINYLDVDNAFLERLMVDNNEDEIVKYFLEKLRNSANHLRIKPVYDNNENMIENAVYIYDEDNYGNNNFNYYVNIHILFNLINEIEDIINDIPKKNKPKSK